MNYYINKLNLNNYIFNSPLISNYNNLFINNIFLQKFIFSFIYQIKFQNIKISFSIYNKFLEKTINLNNYYNNFYFKTISSSSSLSISNSLFLNCYSSTDGGAIKINSGNLNLNLIGFFNCNSPQFSCFYATVTSSITSHICINNPNSHSCFYTNLFTNSNQNYHSFLSFYQCGKFSNTYSIWYSRTYFIRGNVLCKNWNLTNCLGGYGHFGNNPLTLIINYCQLYNITSSAPLIPSATNYGTISYNNFIKLFDVTIGIIYYYYNNINVNNCYFILCSGPHAKKYPTASSPSFSFNNCYSDKTFNLDISISNCQVNEYLTKLNIEFTFKCYLILTISKKNNLIISPFLFYFIIILY